LSLPSGWFILIAMFLLTWIRSAYKALSADATPAAIAFGILFGLVVGSVPLTSGLGMLLIASVLILRVQISSALLALGIAKLLALAGMTRLYVPVGDLLLEAEALRGFWTVFLNLPVIAWLDLDRVAVTGGAVAGAVVGLILFLPVMHFVVAYRRYVHERVSQNRFFRWFTNFFFVKALRFIFVGK
jgi:uncharacterized protein (TIGR03546 family)